KGLKPTPKPVKIELETSVNKPLNPKSIIDIEAQAAASKKQKSGLKVDDAGIYLNPSQVREHIKMTQKAESIKGSGSIPVTGKQEILDKQGVANIEAQAAASKKQKSGLELDPQRGLLAPDEVININERAFAGSEKSKNAPPPAKAEQIISKESLGASLVKKFEVIYTDVKEIGLEEAEKLRGYSLDEVQDDLIAKIVKDIKENYRRPVDGDLNAHLKNILMPATIATKLHSHANKKDSYARTYADLLDLATERLLRKSIQKKKAA
ncbi:hypothetical protein KKG46_01235, partial [Patescibacteria group bacterium]|nr:hypothetical protein [Patescibacteria group bacterium]